MLKDEIKELQSQLQQKEATIHALLATGQARDHLDPHGRKIESEGEVWNLLETSTSSPQFSNGTEGEESLSQEQRLGSSLRRSQAEKESSECVYRWTEVTSSEIFVEHLLTLYFRWEYPIFASLCKKYFLSDFRTGTPRYSSALLINALLAAACRFSDQLEARSDVDDEETSWDHFFEEAMLLLAKEEGQSLTTIQALGLMSIREAGCGRDSESWFFSGQSIRMAVEMGLHKESTSVCNVEHAVRTSTFWGAFALDQ